MLRSPWQPRNIARSSNEFLPQSSFRSYIILSYTSNGDRPYCLMKTSWNIPMKIHKTDYGS